MPTQLQPVDHSALKANQLTIIVLSILAFILNQPWLAAFVAVVMGLGSLRGLPGFLPLYQRVLKPAGLLKPDVLADNPEPHRFAQTIGFVVLGAGALLLLSGSSLGWALVWLVVALPPSTPSAVSASAAPSTTGWCASRPPASTSSRPPGCCRAASPGQAKRMPELLARSLLAVLIIGLGWAALRVAGAQAARRGANRLSELYPADGPASSIVVYFTTPSCAPCKTVQRPAIQRAQQALGPALAVIEIDAEAQPEIAARWGVLSVPSTYLFNANRELKQTNYGVVRFEALLNQLNQLNQAAG